MILQIVIPGMQFGLGVAAGLVPVTGVFVASLGDEGADSIEDGEDDAEVLPLAATEFGDDAGCEAD